MNNKTELTLKDKCLIQRIWFLGFVGGILSMILCTITNNVIVQIIIGLLVIFSSRFWAYSVYLDLKDKKDQ